MTIVISIEGQFRTATVGQETVRTVCAAGTVAVAVAVAAVVTVAVAVAVAAAVAGGHCPTPPLLPRLFLLRALPPAPAPAPSYSPLHADAPKTLISSTSMVVYGDG